MQDLKLEKYLINDIDPHLNFVFKVYTKGLQDQEKNPKRIIPKFGSLHR